MNSIDNRSPDTERALKEIHIRFSRRLFVKLAARGMVTLGATLPFGISVGELVTSSASADSLETFPLLFTSEEKLLVADVQDHLLPSDPNSPGAKDIRATAYLEAALSGSDVDALDLPRIKAGISKLFELLKRGGLRKFSQLSSTQKEKALRDFEKTEDGEIWLRLILGYTLEAYVGDPSYGGNTDGIVWTWLGHTPGFPRPAEITTVSRR